MVVFVGIIVDGVHNRCLVLYFIACRQLITAIAPPIWEYRNLDTHCIMARYFRSVLEAWNFRHLWTDEDTEMDAMIAETDLSQLSTPGSSQI